jgi:hypothetical protein
MVDERHFLLYLPFRRESTLHIEQLEETAQERSRGPLIENHILYEELTLRDSLGHKHRFDVILQEIPCGLMLNDAVSLYRADDLTAAIESMKSRMDTIGFRHNNLSPSNIIICESGKARPLRYWYAEWETFSNNDISELLDFINSNYNEESEPTIECLFVEDCEAEYNAAPRYGSAMRLCRGSKYGFVDSDGVQITPFVYSWASDFCEGRAIVAKNGKMGAIDNLGNKVIPVIYNTLEFDIETGIFTATRNTYRYLIDYEGKIIRRTEIETEEPIQIEVEA